MDTQGSTGTRTESDKQ